MGTEFNLSVEPQGRPKSASELHARKKDAKETGNWQELQKRLEAAEPLSARERAEGTKKDLTRQLQTVFRVNGTFAGYVSEDAVTRFDGAGRAANSADLDKIRSDSSLTSEQRADRLSQRMSENLKAEYGASVEIAHYAPGEGPTVADIRAELNDDYETGSQLLRAELQELDLSPQAFAEVFGEK